MEIELVDGNAGMRNGNGECANRCVVVTPTHRRALFLFLSLSLVPCALIDMQMSKFLPSKSRLVSLREIANICCIMTPINFENQ